jgi:hypothetical protein
MGFNLWPSIAHKSRAGKVDDYPFDYDASERHTRPKTGLDSFPIPWNGNSYAQLGSMPATYRLFDNLVWGQAYGMVPYGPVGQPNLQMQITIPGLNKQMPQA